MQCSAMQCVQVSAVQCSAVQCSAVQCSGLGCRLEQCSAVQCSAVQCSAVQCSAVQCSAVQCSAVQCSAVYFSAMRCNIVQGSKGVRCSAKKFGLTHRWSRYIDSVARNINPFWQWKGEEVYKGSYQRCKNLGTCEQYLCKNFPSLGNFFCQIVCGSVTEQIT